MSHKLMPDMPAPALDLPLLDGGRWVLADQRPQGFTMIVVYRGYHCPVCKVYMTKLNALAGQAAEYGLSILAVSMDGADRAAKAQAEWGLDNLTIAHSLTEQDARNWGLYLTTAIKDAETPVFAEPGLFWVRPDGRLYLVDIANMPFARPDLEILLPKARMALDNNYPARGTRG
jgi:peroxiredoxin